MDLFDDFEDFEYADEDGDFDLLGEEEAEVLAWCEQREAIAAYASRLRVDHYEG